MFLFKKKVREAVFVTANASAFEYNKPDFAQKSIPDWLKNIKPVSRNVFEQQHANIKVCYGLNEFFRKSIMLNAVEDIWVRTLDDGEDGYLMWQMVAEISGGTLHPNWQRGEFRSDCLHFKINPPWSVNAKFNVFQSAPMYHTKINPDFTLAQGIIDWSLVPDCNANFLIKKHVGDGHTDYCIKFDEPLCMFTPLTDEKVKIRHELLSEEEVRKFRFSKFFVATNSNSYNVLKKKKKQNECPFGFK